MNEEQDEDCGCYGPDGKDCFCDRAWKFYYQRLNAIIVLFQFLLAGTLIGVFSSRKPKTNDDNRIQGENSVKDLVVAFICLGISGLMLLVCCIGCCAVCFRCWPFLIVLTPLTFVFGMGLVFIGSLTDRIGDFIERVCDDNLEDIRSFWNKVVDIPMCSDMCPCDNNAFAQGGYA